MGPISRETRETIARLRNCVVALAREKVLLFDTTVQYTYDASLKYEVCLSSLSCDQFKNVIFHISLAQNYLLNIERQNFGIPASCHFNIFGNGRHKCMLQIIAYSCDDHYLK